MKTLWAPWRMEYILSDKSNEECIFCPGSDRSRDESRLILYLDDSTIVLMNLYPYTNGHLLVAPVRHVPDLEKLTDEEFFNLTVMVKKSISILRKQSAPDGFNVGINIGKVAGAGVEEHMHYHIVPRWNGDHNYMTVLGEVRVIPEHIAETYRKLLPYFREL